MTEKPYTGHGCTREVHRLKYDRRLKWDDHRLHACNCGACLIGNGRVVVRPKVIAERFPEEVAA